MNKENFNPWGGPKTQKAFVPVLPSMTMKDQEIHLNCIKAIAQLRATIDTHLYEQKVQWDWATNALNLLSSDQSEFVVSLLGFDPDFNSPTKLIEYFEEQLDFVIPTMVEKYRAQLVRLEHARDERDVVNIARDVTNIENPSAEHEDKQEEDFQKAASSQKLSMYEFDQNVDIRTEEETQDNETLAIYDKIFEEEQAQTGAYDGSENYSEQHQDIAGRIKFADDLEEVKRADVEGQKDHKYTRGGGRRTMPPRTGGFERTA